MFAIYVYLIYIYNIYVYIYILITDLMDIYIIYMYISLVKERLSPGSHSVRVARHSDFSKKIKVQFFIGHSPDV